MVGSRIPNYYPRVCCQREFPHRYPRLPSVRTMEAHRAYCTCVWRMACEAVYAGPVDLAEDVVCAAIFPRAVARARVCELTYPAHRAVLGNVDARCGDDWRVQAILFIVWDPALQLRADMCSSRRGAVVGTGIRTELPNASTFDTNGLASFDCGVVGLLFGSVGALRSRSRCVLSRLEVHIGYVYLRLEHRWQ